MESKVGKKYIIEIAERHTHYNDKGQAYSVYRVKGFNSLFLDSYALGKLEELEEGIEFRADGTFVKVEEIEVQNGK